MQIQLLVPDVFAFKPTTYYKIMKFTFMAKNYEIYYEHYLLLLDTISLQVPRKSCFICTLLFLQTFILNEPYLIKKLSGYFNQIRNTKQKAVTSILPGRGGCCTYVVKCSGFCWE